MQHSLLKILELWKEVLDKGKSVLVVPLWIYTKPLIV